MINKNNNLNGIFATLEPNTRLAPANDIVTTSYHQYFMLYDENNTNESYEYISCKGMDAIPRDFIYLDKKQSIIGQHRGKLYEMKLKDIQSKHDFGQFIEIRQSADKNVRKALRKKGFIMTRYFLNMLYLSDKESIFAIKCTNTLDIGDTFSAEKETDCWMYNVNECKWRSIPNFKYKSVCRSFDCLLCYNDFKQNQIYISAQDRTSMFDLNKSKWVLLCDKSISQHPCTMWCEYDLLYALDEYRYINVNGSIVKHGFRLYTLDTRAWGPKWSVEGISIQRLPKQYFTARCGNLFY